ncbi:50S ribosomal protein L29 [Gammaproteobacteria bacterium]|nr:50S ribosomal protein L29 [Gammaproteobacteria bacterium]
MNATEMREKTREELQQELLSLREEQFKLRMQKGAGQLENPSRVSQLRREIARLKTVMAEQVRAEA